VRVRRRDGDAVEETLPADLVVDASGRGSRAPRWLEELGYEPPDEEVVRVDVRYTTRLFRRTAARERRPRNVLIGALPGQRRGAVALAVENDRWIVTLTGLLGEQPPADLDGFRAFARSLWAGDVHAIAAREEPLGEAVTGAYPANARRRFDRLRRFPGGFVVLGDALSPFNPVYGQGMSMAALEAEALGAVLDRVGPAQAGPAFFRATRARIDDAWTQAVDNDLRHPEVEGPRTLRWRLVNRYAGRLLPVAHRDPVVGRAFLEVMALLAPGASLMRPGVAGRVLLRGGRRAAGPVGSPAGERG
jgi:2-polyprenyl-6-methoxyphenol hydroxylase-like FAD-dependent oxidoreductase